MNLFENYQPTNSSTYKPKNDGFGRPTKEIFAALGALILQQMHDLTDEETVSQFGVRGLSAVGYCARLKAIGVNLFRTARVKRALDALRATPETPLSARGSTILAVKEFFLSPWRRLRDTFSTASEYTTYVFSIAAHFLRGVKDQYKE